MRRHEKNEIKKIRKKNILPFILLFLLCMAVCAACLFVVISADSMADFQMGILYGEAENLGKIITSLVETEHASFVTGVAAAGMFFIMVLMLLMFVCALSAVAAQRRMVNLYYQDPVTGGKNWQYFIQKSRKKLCRIQNTSTTYAMINLHLNEYQDYCACYGSRAGAELLQRLNAFLQVNIGRKETFARFASADFGLLLRCDSVKQCEKRLKKLMAELTGIQKDRGLSYQAGVYMINETGRQARKKLDVARIYHYANAARESISRKNDQYIKIFDEQILQEQLWKRKVEDMMEDALFNREFEMYLQPKYNPVSQKIVGAEALVRWISPTEGIISPGRFIPIFEENGFITRLDDYMISAVAKLQSERKIHGKKLIPVSVNVSRANFTRENLAQHVCQLVDGYGADHSCIELELTESAFFDDKTVLQRILNQLKGFGFRVSMDDFGAGYSSLNSLKDLPIDVLKLDMEFFRGEDKEKRGEIVVTEAIRLAKNLDMETVAEGIERKEQVEFLAGLGCDMIQGFYFAKPMPLPEFDERMERDG